MSSEGCAQCAAHPVGYISPLQLKMAIWRTFFLNFNLLGRVREPDVDYNGSFSRFKLKKKLAKRPVSSRNKPKRDLFRFVSWNQKQKFSVCFDVSNLYRNNRNKQNCFKSNRNKPKIFWKIPKYALYQTVSVGLLFVLVQSKHGNSLFQYRIRNNQNKMFRNKPEQIETTRNNTKFYEKIPIYALYQTVSVGLLFVLVQSKHRNSLFRYTGCGR